MTSEQIALLDELHLLKCPYQSNIVDLLQNTNRWKQLSKPLLQNRLIVLIDEIGYENIRVNLLTEKWAILYFAAW